jgi:uncharacterized iron-regulated membrane protein
LLIGLVSAAVLLLGITGIWMWWLRKQERAWGLLLLAANLVFAVGVLLTIRSAGP